MSTSERQHDVFTTRVVQNEVTAKNISHLNVPMDDVEQCSSTPGSSENNSEAPTRDAKHNEPEQLNVAKLPG